jgi:hypothetical protein
MILVLLALAAAPLAAEDAGALLAKAADTFRANEAKQKHWNWQTVENRELVNRSGAAVQKFPQVTSESVIRSDGRRCNAVVAWGDGKKPYLADADPDERCRAMDATAPPFPPVGVLLNRRARVVSEANGVVTVAVEPDKSKLKDSDFVIRCGASIRATVKLERATSFPLRIEGQVEESGCDSVFRPVNHYETMTRGQMTSNFRKGSTFWVEWSLEKDKTGDPERNFWIPSAQHYSQPWNSEATVLYYWGRQVRVTHEGQRLVKEMRTTAQEFAVGSELIFK